MMQIPIKLSNKKKIKDLIKSLKDNADNENIFNEEKKKKWRIIKELFDINKELIKDYKNELKELAEDKKELEDKLQKLNEESSAEDSSDGEATPTQ